MSARIVFGERDGDNLLGYPLFLCSECGEIADFEVACLIVKNENGETEAAIGACCAADYLKRELAKGTDNL